MPSAPQSLEAVLARVPLFAELSSAELAALAARAGRKSYQSGALIFSEGSGCTELLVVEEGVVRLFKTSPDGREQLIAVERLGGTLAEVPIFDGGRYSFSAVTIEPTTLVHLDAGHFRQICVQNPDMAAKLIKVLAHRLRHLDRLVEQLSFSTVRSRLIAHLLRTAESSISSSANSACFS
jgi:CRP/FNR family transcriptional regulator